MYSMFLVEASSFRGMREVIESRGLPGSIYSDRGSHYWRTPEAGKKVDKAHGRRSDSSRPCRTGCRRNWHSTGVLTRKDAETYWNSAVSIGTSPIQVYSKSHLVPFGEFAPFGFNGRIADILKTHHFMSGEDLEQTLLRYVMLYNGYLSRPPSTAKPLWTP
jgi:hypothetical protein